jgi:hypothetical protein
MPTATAAPLGRIPCSADETSGNSVEAIAGLFLLVFSAQIGGSDFQEASIAVSYFHGILIE